MTAGCVSGRELKGIKLESTQTISKCGSSLAIRLPAAFANQMRLEEGSQVQLAIDGKRLVIQSVEPELDAKSFFAAVKVSQAVHGLVREDIVL